ncbi:hypothetical protein QYE76_020291 [Lolium multiflorum]|uniref:FAS1 domain-containing protein n=1 Tax=Lolium multiflorum TaxID=4521 RepID=A0AAD8R837_LOLMU|nr:hypothetical protein QYE76_020291 [Lolium multiflorum]
MASPVAGVLSAKHALAVLLLILGSYPACHAGENVTAILAGHPELGEFGSLLASTGLTLDIMGRIDPLTVLAVDNDGMAPLRNMPREAIRQHLSLHVLLGLYDPDMLGRLLPGESAELTTLFQRPSGDAPRGVGIVEVSGPDPVDRYPRVSFVPGGPGVGSGVWRLAFFVKSVYEDPNMVVLQVSATMSAPWLPGSPARRDGSGGDAAGSGAKKN